MKKLTCIEILIYLALIMILVLSILGYILVDLKDNAPAISQFLQVL